MTLQTVPSREEVEPVVRQWLDDAFDLVQRSRDPRVIWPSKTDSQILGELAKFAYGEVAALPSFESACSKTMSLPGTAIYARRIHVGERVDFDNVEEPDEKRIRAASLHQLEGLLWHFSRAHGSDKEPDAQEAAVKKCIDEFFTLLLECRIEVRGRAPLYGLSIETAIECNGLRIRPLDPASPEARSFSEFTGFPRQECHAQIESSQVQDFRNADAKGFPDKKWFEPAVRSCVRALRLWTEGDVRPAGFFTEAGMSSMSGGPMEALPSTHYHARPQPLRDPQLFVGFFQRTSAVFASPPPGLASALRRFDIMHAVPRHVDRIVDEVIMLESLFQKGNEKQELTYRLSLRVARFIGRDAKERFEVFQLLKEAYSVRSKIVHGDEASGDDGTLARVSTLVHRVLREYCERAALRLNERKLQEKICDELDAQFLA